MAIPAGRAQYGTRQSKQTRFSRRDWRVSKRPWEIVQTPARLRLSDYEMRNAIGVRFLDDVSGDLVLSLRALRKSLRFAGVAIATIAIGIGGSTAVFSAVDAALLEPLPYPQPDRLVRLYQYEAGEPAARTFVSAPHFKAYRRDLASFDALAAIYTYSESGADIAEYRPGRADQDAPCQRRLLSSHGRRADDRPGLRSRRRGRRASRDPELRSVATPVSRSRGRARRLDDDERDPPGTIHCVMPRGYTDPLIASVDAWVPIDLRPINGAQYPMNHFLLWSAACGQE